MSFSIPNILLGLVGVALGIWVTKEAYYINHHLLFFGWAEQKFGPGYGTIAYRWIGLVLILFSFFVITGYIDVFGPAFGDSQGSNGPRTQIQNSPSGGYGTQIAP